MKESVQKLVFLEKVLDFKLGLISSPEERILKLKSSIDSCFQDNFISARGLSYWSDYFDVLRRG